MSLERLARDKRSCLLGPFTSDEEKKWFITLTQAVNVIKLFSFITDDEA
jgi:hypothetical protein